jgi:hypothetical protein
MPKDKKETCSNLCSQGLSSNKQELFHIENSVSSAKVNLMHIYTYMYIYERWTPTIFTILWASQFCNSPFIICSQFYLNEKKLILLGSWLWNDTVANILPILFLYYQYQINQSLQDLVCFLTAAALYKNVVFAYRKTLYWGQINKFAK